MKVSSGHIDLTNAVVEEDEEIIILATSTDVKVSNPNKVSTHAHAKSESDANAMNNQADSTKKSVGVIWDYDGNVAQNEINDIHHHIALSEAEIASARENGTLGTGPVDGGEEWKYDETVESNVSQKVTEELNEREPNADYVARIGLKGYTTLALAVNEAVAYDTIVMLKDVVLPANQSVSKVLTIDLAGKIISSSGYATLTTANKDAILTIQDSVGGGVVLNDNNLAHGAANSYRSTIIVQKGKFVLKSGTIRSTKANKSAIQALSYKDSINVKIELLGGTVESLNSYGIAGSGLAITTFKDMVIESTTIKAKECAIYSKKGSSISIKNSLIESSDNTAIFGQARTNIDIINSVIRGNTGISIIDSDGTDETELNIQNSEINSTGFAICTNGANTAPTNIKLDNVTINSDSVAMYLPGIGSTEINDSSITGVNSAIEIRNGTLTVKDSTLTATATEYHCTANGNGTTTAAAALAVSQHTTKGDIVVIVDGGTLTGYYAVSVANPQENADTDGNVSVTIKSGTTLNATDETKVLVTDTRANCTVTVEE